jgi:hypothetical protein
VGLKAEASSKTKKSMKEKTKQKLFVKRGGWILPGYLFDIKERGKNLDNLGKKLDETPLQWKKDGHG